MFRPTFLYIKQHSITGKLYFGKTIKHDPIKYPGSGIHWKRHINKHGKDKVETLWYCLFLDEETCKDFAILCSIQWDIVNSDNWLNLIPEDGLIGGAIRTGIKQSIETRKKISESHMGKRLSNETKQKISINIKRWNDKNPESLQAAKLKAAKSRLGFKHSEESKQKMSYSTLGQFCSEETRQKMKESHKGKLHTEDTKKKLSLINTGHFVSEQTKEKLSISAKNRPKFRCKYCSIEITKANLTRWHNEKCKSF